MPTRTIRRGRANLIRREKYVHILWTAIQLAKSIMAVDSLLLAACLLRRKKEDTLKPPGSDLTRKGSLDARPMFGSDRPENQVSLTRNPSQ